MKRPEQEIHRAVVQHLRLRGVPGLVFFHVPNAIHGSGRRYRVQGAIAKSMGVRAGVADLCLFHNGMFYAIELKAPGGRPTEAQLEFLADVDRAGGYTCACEGLDRAIAVLEQWGLLKGTAALAA